MKTKLFMVICTIWTLSPFFSFAENTWEVESEWEEYDNPQSSTEAAPIETASEPVYSTPEPVTAGQDATYTIKKGDTLWDLAFEFLGNPFDWQRIWEINPYIKNPDLIYPGDRLAIPGRTPATVVQTDLIPSETLGALSSENNSSMVDEGYPGDFAILSSIKNHHILSAAHQANAPFLWSEKDKKGYIYPGDGVVEPLKKSASYQLFSKLGIVLYKGASYAVGDTIAIYRSIRFVLFNKKTVNVVKRTGRAVVADLSDRKMEALLVEMNDVIEGNERVAPDTRAERKVIDTLIDPDVTLSAEIFIRVEQTESPYPYQMCILDKGSTHGVQIGDLFAVYSSKNSQISVIGMIVHTSRESSTLCMVHMCQNIVDEGDKAKLLRRAQFIQKDTAADEDETNSTGTEASSQLQSD